MTFGWGSDDPALRQTPVVDLRTRFQVGDFATRYYNPELHLAAFALPQYVLEAIGKVSGANEQANHP